MAFKVSIYLGLGHFTPPSIGLIAVFYFPLINFTSLGLAQIEPVGYSYY
mgnify:CR=1 FL=1